VEDNKVNIRKAREVLNIGQSVNPEEEQYKSTTYHYDTIFTP